ncbi:MAG: extracellular solute-binding protein [Anaerolineae bacterium]
MNTSSFARSHRIPLLLLVLALLLVTATAITAQDTVNLSVAYWGNNQEAAMIDAMLSAFEAENPNITIERIWVPDSYEEKVTTMIAGGTPPDLVQISHTSLPGFVDVFAPVEVDESLYASPLYTRALSYEGELRAVPFVAKPKVMGINVDVFDAAGIPVPNADTPLTAQEFQDLAVQLSSGEGDSRIFGSAPLWFGGWLFAFGNTFYNEDGTQVTIGDQSAIDAAKFVIDATATYHYAPTAVEATGQSMFDWFLSGRVAMYPDFGPWHIPLVKTSSMNWTIVPDPELGEPLEINGFGISTDTLHPDEAKALAVFMGQSETAQNILGTSEAAAGVPVIPSAAEAFAQSIPGHSLVAFLYAAQNAPVPVGNKMDAQIQDEFYREVNARTALGTGSEDPAVVFPELQDTLNAMFNQ